MFRSETAIFLFQCLQVLWAPRGNHVRKREHLESLHLTTMNRSGFYSGRWMTQNHHHRRNTRNGSLPVSRKSSPQRPPTEPGSIELREQLCTAMSPIREFVLCSTNCWTVWIRFLTSKFGESQIESNYNTDCQPSITHQKLSSKKCPEPCRCGDLCLARKLLRLATHRGIGG